MEDRFELEKYKAVRTLTYELFENLVSISGLVYGDYVKDLSRVNQHLSYCQELLEQIEDNYQLFLSGDDLKGENL